MRLSKLSFHLIVIMTTVFSTISFSQESVIEFEDATKMKFRVLDNTPERQKPGIMRIGLGFGLSYQYWKQNKFVIDGGATTQSSLEANFLYALIKSQKEKKRTSH